MILRRVTEHVKAQNWFAVLIDFVIVVIGVFIGIQVANWNEQRVEDKRVRAALETMFAETEENVSYAKLIIYRNARLQEHRDAAMATLQGREPASGDPARGLALLSFIRDFTPRYTGYDELRAAGDVARVQSKELRLQQSQLVGVTRYNDRRRDELVATLPDILALADDYVTLAPEGVEAQPLAASVDWEAARGDRTLRNAAARAMAAQRYWTESLEAYLVEVTRTCDLLGDAVGRECTPPDWIADEKRREEEAA